MERTFWIVIAVIAIAIAAFLGVRTLGHSKQVEAEREQRAAIERELDESRRAAKEAERRASQEEEARAMAEDAAKKRAEAEARRLAQLQAERQEQDLALKRSEEEAAKTAAEMERIRVEKARLESEARRLSELRAQEAAEANRKLEDAQSALAETERSKNAEIERQAALLASYSRQPSTVPLAAAHSEDRVPRSRIIFPADYKRASHYSLPIITGASDE